MLHILVCKSDSKWTRYVREHHTVNWSLEQSVNSLTASFVDASFSHGLNHALTYSERQAEDVMADVAEEREQIAGIDRAIDLTILAPELRWDGDDRWATIQKSPGEFRLWSARGEFRGFRQNAIFDAVIKEQILVGFFGFNTEDNRWRTFTPGKAGAERVMYLRELYVRPTWNARLLAPDSFRPFHGGPVVTPEMAAKRVSKLPQAKAAARRERHLENAARFRAEAAERARQRGEVA